MNEYDLLELKEDIEDAKRKIAELQGEKRVLEQQLKENFGCENMEQAKKLLEQMKQEKETLDLEIREGLDKLSDMLEEQ